LNEQGLSGRVDGILLDLGVSSPQLDDPARGFSFSRDGPLDMRMDPTSGLQRGGMAAIGSTKRKLERVLAEYGEERFHRRVARALVVPPASKRRSPPRRSWPPSSPRPFRPANRESILPPDTFRRSGSRSMMNWASCGRCCRRRCALAPGGRLAVISFHSLEDRMVKRFMREQARGGNCRWICRWHGRQKGMTLRLIGRAVRGPAPRKSSPIRARAARCCGSRSGWHEKPDLLIALLTVRCSAPGSGWFIPSTQPATLHQSQKLQAERDDLEVEWELLQLEQSTLVTDAAIEDSADAVEYAHPDPGEVLYIYPHEPHAR
jgi:cell division protein FtsL